MADKGTADHELVRRKGSDTWAVLKIKNEGTGVPASVEVEGTFKCLTCLGYVKDDLICQECRVSIRLMRSGPHADALESLLSMIVANPGFLRALEHMTNEAITAYFVEKLRHPGD
jgi:hypothetical protein